MTTDTLPKPNTQLLRRILTGIASGELEHEQAAWHCGSAHCVAGWAEVIEAEKQGFEYDSDKELFYLKSTPESLVEYPFAVFTPLFAKEELGLTGKEAHILFGLFTSFLEQVAILDCLERGQRITDDEFLIPKLTEEDAKRILDNPPSNQKQH